MCDGFYGGRHHRAVWEKTVHKTFGTLHIEDCSTGSGRRALVVEGSQGIIELTLETHGRK